MPGARLVTYGAAGFFLLIWFYIWGTPVIDARHGLAVLSALDDVVVGAATSDSRRILILQHMPPTKTFLERASRLSHKVYAQAWGYRYYAVPFEYTQIQMLHRGFNKHFALRAALETELKKDDGAEWILYADATTLVSNPAVPVHALLPPADLTPAPYVLGAQTDAGFTAAVLLIRVTPAVLGMVSATISAGKAERQPAVSDQHYLSNTLRANATFAQHFYEMPQAWLHAEDGAAAAHAEAWVPRLHVAVQQQSFRPVAQATAAIYREAQRLAAEAGQAVGSGLDLMPEQGWTAAQARDWWGAARGGIHGMRFVDESQLAVVLD